MYKFGLILAAYFMWISKLIRIIKKRLRENVFFLCSHILSLVYVLTVITTPNAIFSMIQIYLFGFRKLQNNFFAHSSLHISYICQHVWPFWFSIALFICQQKGNRKDYHIFFMYKAFVKIFRIQWMYIHVRIYAIPSTNLIGLS